MSEEKLASIDHVTINVADVERAVSWYRTSFACEIISQDKVSAILQFANMTLTLMLPSQEPPHLAFVKADADTYGELFEKRDGKKSTFVSDPTGNMVELIAP